MDRSAKTENGRRIACRRIVVGHRPADGATVAHLTVADAAGKSRQRRDRTLHNRRFGHIDMPGHGADADGISGILDPGQAALGKVHHRFRAGKTLLHGRDQCHAAGQELAARRHMADSLVGARRLYVVGLIHGLSLLIPQPGPCRPH